MASFTFIGDIGSGQEIVTQKHKNISGITIVCVYDDEVYWEDEVLNLKLYILSIALRKNIGMINQV